MKDLGWSILRAILFVIVAMTAICGLEQIGNVAQAHQLERIVAQQAAIAILAIATIAMLFGSRDNR